MFILKRYKAPTKYIYKIKIILTYLYNLKLTKFESKVNPLEQSPGTQKRGWMNCRFEEELRRQHNLNQLV